MKRLRLLLTLPLLLTCSMAGANSFEWLMKENEAPPGVVIEIIGERELLRTLMPELARDIEALREKFPGIPVAIVSHGAEQFLMTSSSAAEAPDTHQLVQSLVRNDAVDFHVCGTHASWYDVMPEDFPDYVDVAPAAPAQIRHYEDLGYELIVLP
jgi:intracellular sulfur oxidation DsrE/DsrF family protein